MATKHILTAEITLKLSLDNIAPKLLQQAKNDFESFVLDTIVEIAKDQRRVDEPDNAWPEDSFCHGIVVDALGFETDEDDYEDLA